jgi:hypothetical protein
VGRSDGAGMRFGSASITKVFTAVATLQLIEGGLRPRHVCDRVSRARWNRDLHGGHAVPPPDAYVRHRRRRGRGGGGTSTRICSGIVPTTHSSRRSISCRSSSASRPTSLRAPAVATAPPPRRHHPTPRQARREREVRRDGESASRSATSRGTLHARQRASSSAAVISHATATALAARTGPRPASHASNAASPIKSISATKTKIRERETRRPTRGGRGNEVPVVSPPNEARAAAARGGSQRPSSESLGRCASSIGGSG